MRLRVVLAIAVFVTVGPATALANPSDGCKGEAVTCGTGSVTSTAVDFRGAIVVPGSEAANAEVARTHGCDGCVWTLVLDCDRNSVQDPAYVNCNAARCPDGSLFRLYLQRTADARPEYVDTICLSATRRIVTAADLAVDAERYLTSLTPPPPTITVQPEGRAVTGLATYFAAGGTASTEQTLDVTTAAGPARLGIAISAREYAWDFGDGTGCVTASAGGAYDGGGGTERCDDRVAHVYATAAPRTVSLTATWAGTYTFDVGYGAVGPLGIPGDGVATPRVTRRLDVREARAELVGG
jgi:hypothetical protein